MIEPMLAAEPGTLALFALMVLFCAFVVPIGAVVAIVYITTNRSKSKPQPAPAAPIVPPTPAPTGPVAPVPPAFNIAHTEIMPHKCPQCGTTLPPDAPEGLCPACLLQKGFATEVPGSAAPVNPASAFVPPPISELAPLFPQLEIQQCLGRGGMGAVYKARQPRLDRFVALKILAPEKQNDPQFAERFEREARVLAKLNHPNIVSVFDFGEVQGRFYLTMEYVDGLTLRQVIQAGKISPAEALELVPKICEALQYAHEHGIVHRDIKPENILMDKQGRVKIADFGIAKIAGLDATGLSLTGARDVMGTPHYMAPEQVEKPLTVDHRADIYSLGVVFYEMLTGELPLGKFAPPSRTVGVDVRLDEVVLHALEKEPSRRYQHASQVKTAVETIAGSPGQIGPVPPAMVVGSDVSDKTILPAFLLAFFFGVFGAHRFYVGKFGTAILQLCTCGGFGIWATIDWILIVCKASTDADGRRLTNWINPGPSAPRPVPMPSAEYQIAAERVESGRFWRRFAVVAALVLMIPVALAIFGILLAIAIPNFVKGRSSAKSYTAEELKQAGIHKEGHEYWKHSDQTFPLNTNGEFKIDNINGRVEVHGWSSNVVAITTAIHGKTGASVAGMRINIDSSPDQVAVHTKGPETEDFRWSWDWFVNAWENNATVDYTVHVPDTTRLEGVSSVNGRIEIEGVAGDISASTVNGEAKILDATRNLKLETVNGNLSAQMNSLGADQSVSFNAVNGTIKLILPENTDARFSMHTINGGISSEFAELQAKKEFPVGNSLKASVGNGSAQVKGETVNGSIEILKRPKQPNTTNPLPEAP